MLIPPRYIRQGVDFQTHVAMVSSAFLLVTFLAAGAVFALPADNKIVGGQKVNISSVPWQVALLKNYSHLCGGTIISPHWIISAAHCTSDADVSLLSVRVGSNYHASGGKIYQIEKVVYNERYVNFSRDDIILLKVTEAMEFNENVSPAILPERNDALPTLGTKLTVSGWGFVNSSYRPEDLYAVDIELLDFAECAELYKEYRPDENLHVCAGTPGLNACKRDSGGPLVHGKHVLGVVSYGLKPCRDFPGVFTKVSAHRGWIKDKTGL